MCRFLLVALNIEVILGEVTIGLRRKKLEEMARGDGLSDAYAASLARMKRQKGNKPVLGLKVLKWVLYSERPLRAEELCHALAVEMGSLDMDPKNIPALRTLLSSCQGLVMVEASSSTVRLVHFTLQEHLLSNPSLSHSPHSTIAEVCLTYLNFECIRELSPIADSPPPMIPFLEYASIYWGKHARMGMTENVKILALRLLDRFDEHISAQLLLLHYNNEHCSRGLYLTKGEGPRGFTGLHGVSFLGIVEIAAAVLKMKEWDVNATDCTGSTALLWAAGKGYEEVVKVLLGRKDVDPNQRATAYGRTPLSCAAKNGHEGVVKILLEREDINPCQEQNSYDRTLLSWAVDNGHEGVVRMLLKWKEVNPNQGGPLLSAALNGHEAIVKMLLEREDINPCQEHRSYGRTLLSWAAGNGNEGVVRMLLERKDVDPNQKDPKTGWTPLMWAKMSGHEGVVKMLLERQGADINHLPHTRLALLFKQWKKKAQSKIKGENTAAERWASGMEDDSRGWWGEV